jgi:hypothetical protein
LLIHSLDSFAGFAGWICWLDLLAGFACWICLLLSLDSLAALAGFARYSHWTLPVSSQWIRALLSQDSFADSLAGFVRWIRSLDSLAKFARCFRWIRSLLSLDSLATHTGPSR